LVSGTFWIVFGSWSSRLTLTWARSPLGSTEAEAAGEAAWDPDAAAEAAAEDEAETVTEGPVDTFADWGAGDAFVEPQPDTRAPAIRTPNSAAISSAGEAVHRLPRSLGGPFTPDRSRPRCSAEHGGRSAPLSNPDEFDQLAVEKLEDAVVDRLVGGLGAVRDVLGEQRREVASPSARPAAISRSRSGQSTGHGRPVPRTDRRCALTSPRRIRAASIPSPGPTTRSCAGR